MDWAQILVIILAIFLAIFLIVGIILVVLLIKVTKQIRAVAGSAERTVKAFEKTVTQVRAVASPIMIMKMVGKYMKKHTSKGGSHVDKR